MKTSLTTFKAEAGKTTSLGNVYLANVAVTSGCRAERQNGRPWTGSIAPPQKYHSLEEKHGNKGRETYRCRLRTETLTR
jgi:hypothetical protein